MTKQKADDRKLKLRQCLEELQLMLRNLQIKEETVQEVILYAKLKGRSKARI
ncbi:hypothetical protein [Shouchella patagoniensis]|uniref:hypothetical protein n=1 Tax=Shouchella patagoniensis TaxID=228576 RepID=UPI001475EFA7|nr:hypothetical protein [Shouchella patagoniensis]